MSEKPCRFVLFPIPINDNCSSPLKRLIFACPSYRASYRRPPPADPTARRPSTTLQSTIAPQPRPAPHLPKCCEIFVFFQLNIDRLLTVPVIHPGKRRLITLPVKNLQLINRVGIQIFCSHLHIPGKELLTIDQYPADRLAIDLHRTVTLHRYPGDLPQHVLDHRIRLGFEILCIEFDRVARDLHRRPPRTHLRRLQQLQRHQFYLPQLFHSPG